MNAHKFAFVLLDFDIWTKQSHLVDTRTPYNVVRVRIHES